MSECIIEFKNVSLAKDGKTLFENLNLQICEGDKVLVWGWKHGANELLQLISGDLVPDQGEVVINGTVRNASSSDSSEDNEIWKWKEFPDCFLAIEENEFPSKKDNEDYRTAFPSVMLQSKSAVITSFRKDKMKMCNKFLHLDQSTVELKDSFRGNSGLDNMYYLASI